MWCIFLFMAFCHLFWDYKGNIEIKIRLVRFWLLRQTFFINDCNGNRTHNHLVCKLNSHLYLRYLSCFQQGVPWHSGNNRVWIYSKTSRWPDKNIQSFFNSFLISNSTFLVKFFSCFVLSNNVSKDILILERSHPQYRHNIADIL